MYVQISTYIVGESTWLYTHQHACGLAPMSAHWCKLVQNNTMVKAEKQVRDEAEKQHFFALADRLHESDDPDERQHIKEELARMTLGNSWPRFCSNPNWLKG